MTEQRSSYFRFHTKRQLFVCVCVRALDLYYISPSVCCLPHGLWNGYHITHIGSHSTTLSDRNAIKNVVLSFKCSSKGTSCCLPAAPAAAAEVI